MFNKVTILITFTILSLLTANAEIPIITSAEFAQHNVKIDNAWIRAAKGKNTAAYFSITNDNDHRIEILQAKAQGLARKIELHETYKEIAEGQEILKMRSVDKIIVPAHTTIDFKPKSTHVMCMGLQQKLEEKDEKNVSLSLIIDNKGEKQEYLLNLPVKLNKKAPCRCGKKNKTK